MLINKLERYIHEYIIILLCNFILHITLFCMLLYSKCYFILHVTLFCMLFYSAGYFILLLYFACYYILYVAFFCMVEGLFWMLLYFACYFILHVTLFCMLKGLCEMNHCVLINKWIAVSWNTLKWARWYQHTSAVPYMLFHNKKINPDTSYLLNFKLSMCDI